MLCVRRVEIPSIVPWLGSGVLLNLEGFSFCFEYFLLPTGSRMYIMTRLCFEFDIFIASVPSQRATVHYHRNAKAERWFATLRIAHLHTGTPCTCSAYLERASSHTHTHTHTHTHAHTHTHRFVKYLVHYVVSFRTLRCLSYSSIHTTFRECRFTEMSAPE